MWEWECGNENVGMGMLEWECGNGNVGMGIREWECGNGNGLECNLNAIR